MTSAASPTVVSLEHEVGGDRSGRRIRRSIGIGTAVAAVPFFAMLWDFSWFPLRTASSTRFASGFYDLQARALFHGHLDVPAGSLGIEGFVVDDRTYMYFPPFPALLRMPLLFVTDRLDGRLTAPSMALAWVVLMAATAWLLWSVRGIARGPDRVSRMEAATHALVLATVGGGSIVLFLAALPWVYHEVYLWAAASAVTVVAGIVDLQRRPTWPVVGVTIGGVLGAVGTRTTTGWAMAATAAVVGLIVARRPGGRRIGVVVVGAAVTVLLLGIVVNWVKFRHPYLFPLRDQVWTSVNSRRRLALRMNGGGLTGPQFFPSSLVNYLSPVGIRFTPFFPYITLPAHPARSHGGAFLDQSYRTGGVPAFTPLLFTSAVWGAVTAFRRSGGALRAMRLPILGTLAITVGVMFYGYHAYRYTSEFLPVLIVGAVVGAVDLVRVVERHRRRVRRAFLGVVATLATFGAVANGAAGLAAARTTWGGERLVNYVSAQERLDVVGALDAHIEQSDVLPEQALTDELHIVGDCRAVYLGSGDQYKPWIVVAVRDLTVDVDVGDTPLRAGVLPLLELRPEGTSSATTATTFVMLESSADQRVRLRFGGAVYFFATEWFPVSPGDAVTLTLVADPVRERFALTFSDRPVEYLSIGEWDTTWRYRNFVPSFPEQSAEDQEAVGVTVASELGAAPSFCRRLQDRVALPTS
ncbi:hypothetical protein BH24ACT5_BH24ACT5_03690 [soil metagenome]